MLSLLGRCGLGERQNALRRENPALLLLPPTSPETREQSVCVCVLAYICAGPRIHDRGILVHVQYPSALLQTPFQSPLSGSPLPSESETLMKRRQASTLRNPTTDSASVTAQPRRGTGGLSGRVINPVSPSAVAEEPERPDQDDEVPEAGGAGLSHQSDGHPAAARRAGEELPGPAGGVQESHREASAGLITGLGLGAWGSPTQQAG